MNKGIVDTFGCPVNFIQSREHHASRQQWSSRSSTAFLSSRIDSAQSLYKRDLQAHFGCVNAIEFSQNGRYLISGGDDRRILLWNLEASMNSNEGFAPCSMKEEHGSNIFCLSFDSETRHIFSAGNDEQVIVHDVETKEAVNVFLHEEAIYGVSINPYNNSVFASAGEDGQILVFDTRASSADSPQQLARSYDAFHSVQFHPTEPQFVLSANSKDGVILWDTRKPRIPCIKYGSKKSPQSSMCARFNSTGSQIIALRRRMHPILFNAQSPIPVCEFDGDYYYNSCTMKSCCFAGSRDQFVLSGSDDFNLYMWHIPDPVFEKAFVPEADLVLKGHRSIVNQVRFNSHNSMIASSGVEKIVKIWSPVPVPGSFGTLAKDKKENQMSRKVYTHEDYIGLVLDIGQTVSHDYSHGSTDEDPKMMAFFDSLVQREVEGWTTNSDPSDEQDDVEDESNLSPNSSSSRISSLSDESDADSSVSTHTVDLPIRRRGFRYRSSASTLSPEPPSQDCVRDPDGDTKPSQDSQWILRLISNKRNQLKAAQKKRRRSKKKQRLKNKQLFRIFSSSCPMLYRPDSSANHTNRASPVHLLRRRSTVAPYTMMSLRTINETEENNQLNGRTLRTNFTDTDEDTNQGSLSSHPHGSSGINSNTNGCQTQESLLCYSDSDESCSSKETGNIVSEKPFVSVDNSHDLFNRIRRVKRNSVKYAISFSSKSQNRSRTPVYPDVASVGLLDSNCQIDRSQRINGCSNEPVSGSCSSEPENSGTSELELPGTSNGSILTKSRAGSGIKSCSQNDGSSHQRSEVQLTWLYQENEPNHTQNHEVYLNSSSTQSIDTPGPSDVLIPDILGSDIPDSLGPDLTQGSSGSPTTVNGSIMSAETGTVSTPDSGISVSSSSKKTKSSPEKTGTQKSLFKKKKIPDCRLKGYRSRLNGWFEDLDNDSD